ncbi:BAHD family acyltransferase, clade I [Selaginella moellendorffii]|uniref:BAHD family acyltransferase, clade I n=1 Tax=Selaginella moellendorffii TaxID=88036 RepID=D8SG31_SELML|nr:shikimate O-hydroxycinnamoyltransferase [Selaginella moellendorffii]EFJ16611.1 BAHD family acyltransferase, clade I [Selaginella moellendorffii]|eukprot:XP_002982366.1 shikimate O-hydroxycinnamoyltransferase [Selaginella moellendorffii]
MEEVAIVSSEFVTPANAFDHPPKFELSTFDRLMGYAGYQKRILFYRSAPENVEDLLKSSLAEVLVPFYPFASRMRAGDGVSTPALELDCSSVDFSAKFTVATTKKSLAQLGFFEPCEFCDTLCQIGSPPPAYPWKIEDPLLFVQITRFGCGGVSLGVGFSHQVADGVSFWHFMTSWAEIARTGQMISPPPVISYNYKGLELSEEEHMRNAVGYWGAEIVPSAEKMPLVVPNSSPLATRQYRFDRSAIAELKSRAAAGSSDARFSTYVALCAEFWQRTVIAQGFPDSQTVRFFVLASCRGRIASIPTSYFGNAICGLSAIASAGDLKNRGLPFAARTIHDAIQAFDGARAESALSTILWMMQAPRPVRVTPFGQSVSSNQHPVEKSEFGFGKPCGITFGTNDLHEGKIYLFPSSDGGVVVTVVLKEENMKRMI